MSSKNCVKFRFTDQVTRYVCLHQIAIFQFWIETDHFSCLTGCWCSQLSNFPQLSCLFIMILTCPLSPPPDAIKYILKFVNFVKHLETWDASLKLSDELSTGKPLNLPCEGKNDFAFALPAQPIFTILQKQNEVFIRKQTGETLEYIVHSKYQNLTKHKFLMMSLPQYKFQKLMSWENCAKFKFADHFFSQQPCWMLMVYESQD